MLVLQCVDPEKITFVHKAFVWSDWSHLVLDEDLPCVLVIITPISHVLNRLFYSHVSSPADASQGNKALNITNMAWTCLPHQSNREP